MKMSAEVVETGEQEVAQKYTVEVKHRTLSAEQCEEAVSVAKDALVASRVEKDVAAKIKKFFDTKYIGSTWHCIVGKHFAASFTHDTASVVFFKINQHHIILFKSDI